MRVAAIVPRYKHKHAFRSTREREHENGLFGVASSLWEETFSLCVDVSLGTRLEWMRASRCTKAAVSATEMERRCIVRRGRGTARERQREKERERRYRTVSFSHAVYRQSGSSWHWVRWRLSRGTILVRPWKERGRGRERDCKKRGIGRDLC